MSGRHIMHAITEALADPYAFLRVIVESADRQAALLALQDRYGWDEGQARMVMDMQFRRATRADREFLVDQLERLEG